MEPKIATIPIYYTVKGKKIREEIKFKGNFKFKLDDNQYYVKNGHVYNSKGEKLRTLGNNAAVAKQLKAMTNFAIARTPDNTFSEKDMIAAQGYNDENCEIRFRGLIGLVGTEQTEIFTDGLANYDKKTGTFTTKGRDTNYKYHTVSIWR